MVGNPVHSWDARTGSTDKTSTNDPVDDDPSPSRRVARVSVREFRQGWCRDPFGRFEFRYFSNNEPTALVRSHGLESRDDPHADEAAIVTAIGDDEEAVPAPTRPVLHPVLYPARSHRILALVLIALAVIVPVTACVTLATTGSDRVFFVADFAAIAAALTILTQNSIRGWATTRGGTRGPARFDTETDHTPSSDVQRS